MSHDGETQDVPYERNLTEERQDDGEEITVFPQCATTSQSADYPSSSSFSSTLVIERKEKQQAAVFSRERERENNSPEEIEKPDCFYDHSDERILDEHQYYSR